MKSGLVPFVSLVAILSFPIGGRGAECQPVFTTIQHNRNLPHAYVDQGLETIPTIYPKHILLLQRRYSTIGSVEYSLLVYKEDSTKDTITIEGSAVRYPDAWTFQTKCQAESTMECLVVTLEKVAALAKAKQ
jgi:hypothetical protein